MRWLTAGESHGRGLLSILEGFPSGIPVSATGIDAELARRQAGFGRGGRMKIEKDRVQILAGIRHGFTLGSPIGLLIPNRDWDNWQEEMSPEPGGVSKRVVTRPRPGHADLAGAMKYARRDLRDILERSSARETAAKVALGACAKALLLLFGIEVQGMVRQIGEVRLATGESPDDWAARAEESPVRCPDLDASSRMTADIETARTKGDTLGGVFEIRVLGCPPGLGSHVQADRRLDGRLAAALMSIPAIKGVEIGLGFAAAAAPGSLVHDPIGYDPQRGFFRPSNRAGGVEGGITNGEELVLRAAMKPIPTLMHPLPSVDLQSKEPDRAAVERSDVCAVPAASVVGEAAVALEVAAAFLDKFGGDSREEIEANYAAYRRSVRNF